MFVGQSLVTVDEMLKESEHQKEFELMNQDHATGSMVIENISLEEELTLVDYLRTGW